MHTPAQIDHDLRRGDAEQVTASARARTAPATMPPRAPATVVVSRRTCWMPPARVCEGPAIHGVASVASISSSITATPNTRVLRYGLRGVFKAPWASWRVAPALSCRRYRTCPRSAHWRVPRSPCSLHQGPAHAEMQREQVAHRLGVAERQAGIVVPGIGLDVPDKSAVYVPGGIQHAAKTNARWCSVMVLSSGLRLASGIGLRP